MSSEKNFDTTGPLRLGERYDVRHGRALRKVAKTQRVFWRLSCAGRGMGEPRGKPGTT